MSIVQPPSLNPPALDPSAFAEPIGNATVPPGAALAPSSAPAVATPVTPARAPVASAGVMRTPRLAARWWAHVWRWRRKLAAPLLCGTSLLCLLAIAFAWGWAAAPTTAGLSAWVHSQDARHGAPYTPLAQVSPLVADALIATEDERFYSHHGIDTIGLARAAWDDLRSGHFSEGGSTLTAQLAKNAYLDGYDHTLPLKLKDLMLALKVEARYPKTQILEMYLNLVYFGEGGYGIGQASERYFGIAPAHLDVAESALLAGLVRAPGMYDPWCHPDLAKLRQGEVLTLMVADGFITPAQARAAGRETFPFWAPGASRPGDTYCAS